MSRTATEIARLVAQSLASYRVPATAIIDQLAGTQVAPAAPGSPGVVDPDDFEPALGNPAADAYVLASTAAGARSWIAQSGGAPLASTAPATLTGTAAVGVGTSAARDDHAHAVDASAGTALREAIDDAVAGLLVAGGNVSLSYNDAAGTLTISVANYPAVSGLTTGQPLRATAAGAVGFGALDLSNASAITGDLPDANLSANVPLLNASSNVYTGDAYLNSDTTSLMSRVANMALTPSDHFTSAFSGYTWATDAGVFGGAPSTVNVGTFPSVLLIRNGTSGQNHFAYQTISTTSKTIYARLFCTQECYAGLRIDAGNNTNAMEFRLTEASGLLTLVARYIIGGVVTTTTLMGGVLAQYLVVAIQNDAAASRWYFATNTPYQISIGGVAHSSITWTRCGMIYGLTSGASANDRAAFFDWVAL
jgi:hypothetical protein